MINHVSIQPEMTSRHNGIRHRITFTTASTPLGWLLVAATERGVCEIALGDDALSLESDLHAAHPNTDVLPAEDELRGVVNDLVDYLSGRGPLPGMSLDVMATEFRRRVWKALQEIPCGETRSYSELAESIGAPGSARAVANACAGNPVALVIPCHRVVRRDGSTSGYRWGAERKRQLLEMEAAMRVGG